jgi:hypothetical protein
MRALATLIRTSVILLLTLRVLACPLAMRPAAQKDVRGYRLTARICAWPAAGPQRSISSAIHLLRPHPKGSRESLHPVRSLDSPALFHAAVSRSAHRPDAASPASLYWRLSERLRC